MIKRILPLIFFIFASFFFFAPKDIFAATPNNVSCINTVGDIGVNTALGCVPVEMDKFIAWLLPLLFSVAGAIAFLLMVYGFILMTTSSGDPKAVQGARDTVTSAIIGLLVSIFAIFIFRLIALDILQIPGIS